MALPISILIVDDEPEVGELLASILEIDGHACTFCRSGVEALQAMRCAHRSFDLLITDHHMPGSLGGLDLVRIARAKGFRRQVVVMSGHLTDEMKADYRVFSVLGFLPKPFDMKLLRAFAQGTSLVPSPFREAARVSPVIQLGRGSTPVRNVAGEQTAKLPPPAGALSGFFRRSSA